MKKHIPLFMLCCALFFASCDDSTTKDEANQEAAYYEMSFHMYALENETEDAQNQLDQTKQEIEENCKGEQDMSEICQVLRQRRDSLESLIDNKQSQIEILKKRFVKIDPPVVPDFPNPHPCPEAATCIPSFESLLVMDQIEKIDISFIDKEGKAFNPVEKIVKESGYPGFVKHELMDLNGIYTMKVKKYSPLLEGETQYEIDLAIQEIPK